MTVPTAGRSGCGLLLVDVGDEADHLLELVEVDVLLGGDFDELGVAAHVGGLQAAGGELLDDLLRVGFGLVDLVDGHDDRHVGGAGVVDGLEGLGHDAVVGGDDDDDDVGDLGAAGAHAGEGLVAGGVEEDDLATEGGRVFLGDVDLVGADVLGDAAGFAGGDVGGADGVEERGLAVVDVAHDGDDGRADDFDQAGGVFEEAFDGLVLDLLFDGDDGGVGAELAGDVLDELGVERLVDGDDDAAQEQRGDEVLTANVELLGEVLDGDALGDGDGPGDGEGLAGDLATPPSAAAAEALDRAFLVLLVALVAASALAGTGAGALAGGWRVAGPGACRRELRRGGRRSRDVHRSRDVRRRGRSRDVRGLRRGRWAAGEGAGGVHGAACAGSRGSGDVSRAAGGLRARALEDGTAALRGPGAFAGAV